MIEAEVGALRLEAGVIYLGEGEHAIDLMPGDQRHHPLQLESFVWML